MGIRDDVAARLERAAMNFEKAGQLEQSRAIDRVAMALRDLHPSLADDLVEEIVLLVTR